MDTLVHSCTSKRPLCGQFNSPVGADPPDLVFGYPCYRLGRGDKDGGDENDSGGGGGDRHGGGGATDEHGGGNGDGGGDGVCGLQTTDHETTVGERWSEGVFV